MGDPRVDMTQVEALHVSLQQSFSPDSGVREPAEASIKHLKFVPGATQMLLHITEEKQVRDRRRERGGGGEMPRERRSGGRKEGGRRGGGGVANLKRVVWRGGGNGPFILFLAIRPLNIGTPRVTSHSSYR